MKKKIKMENLNKIFELMIFFIFKNKLIIIKFK